MTDLIEQIVLHAKFIAECDNPVSDKHHAEKIEALIHADIRLKVCELKLAAKITKKLAYTPLRKNQMKITIEAYDDCLSLLEKP